MSFPASRESAPGNSCSAMPWNISVRCILRLAAWSLNVNRNNRALHFYERMGMRKLREGDFPIGDGYYMNDYIMGLDIK